MGLKLNKIKENDIICVEVNNGTKIEGKVLFMDEGEIMLDCSEKYSAKIGKVSLEDIIQFEILNS